MNKTIERIYKEYGEMVFRMGLTHLFNVGADKLLNSDIEADCADMIATTPANSLISGEMQAQIHRCGAALAKIDVWEIFKFIQTEIGIDSVQTHPGKFLRFQDRRTGHVITEFRVSCDTDKGDIYEVVKIMGITANSLSPSQDVLAECIHRAFRMKGIRPEPINYDFTFEL